MAGALLPDFITIFVNDRKKKPAHPHKNLTKPRLDPDLDVGEAELLDASAAKHKLAVRPKKNHPRGKSPQNGSAAAKNERWLVRVLEDVAGGDVVKREGWVPARVLKDQHSGEEKEREQQAYCARRQVVVRELIETEEEFGRDMQQVVSRYMKPIDKASTPKAVFDNRELLFSNFRQISEFHNTGLLEGIKYYSEEPRMLGRALLRMEREFDKHVAYCRDEPLAQHLLANDPVVHKYFADLSAKLGDDKGIAEHLKLPIQRINDYQLLLKELVKYSKRLGDDCTDLQKALELFLGVPNRATDNKFISSIEGYRGNIYKLGRLLTHDWFTVTDSEGKAKERYLFLFKARILVCKVRRISDDRSVFVLKDIIKLPEVELKDHQSDNFKFELHDQRIATYPITLTAHKEQVKTIWLNEIRQHSSDVVALAEHAADDLQVVSQAQSPPQVVSPEPSEAVDKPKKRDVSESKTEETEVVENKQSKRSRVDEFDTAQSPSQVVSPEPSEVVDKPKKRDVSEVKTEETEVVQNKQSKRSRIDESDTAQSPPQVVYPEPSEAVDKSKKSDVSEVKTEETEVVENKQTKRSRVEESDTAQSPPQVVYPEPSEAVYKAKKSDVSEVKTEEAVVENKQTKRSRVDESDIQILPREESLQQLKAKRKASFEKTEISNKVLKSEITESSISETLSATTNTSTGTQSTQITVQESKASVQSAVNENSQSVAVTTVTEKSQVSSEAESTRRESLKSTVQSSGSIAACISTKKESSTAAVVSADVESELSYKQSTHQSSSKTTTLSKEQTELDSLNSTVQRESKTESVELTTVKKENQAVDEITTQNQSSVQEVVSDKETDLSSKTTEVKQENSQLSGEENSAQAETENVQTVTNEDSTDEMSSRYGRSSRLSEEYSSSRKLSSSGRYESSSNYGSGTSSYSRKESGSRIESGGRYDAGGSIEGSRYESSSNYESTTSALEGTNSKYGLSSKYGSAESQIEGISSKYGLTSKYDSAESQQIDGGSSRYSLTSKLDSADSQIDGISSRYESKYSSSKTMANGSVSSNEYAESRSITKSASAGDGKPVFKKTLEGQNIEPGENAVFECSISESSESVKVTWLKDNKPLTDRLMDRVTISSKRDGSQKLEVQHCREDDSGLYTARAENKKGNAHCTAQLVVHELTAEERREKNALNAPYFVVALNDTEILENTYLRFMVKVKGDPNPEVTFFRDGKELASESEAARTRIVRTRAARGCYELVIADVTPADAGRYSCRALNLYGDVTCEARVAVVDDKNLFGELAPGGEGLLTKGEKPSFTWKRDGVPFDPEERFKVLLGDDEDSLALVFQHVKPEDAGLYTCVAKTSTGNISCSAELTVQGAVNHLYREPEKPKLVIEHREAIVSAGGSAMLELQCIGYPKPDVVFKHKGKVIEPDTRHKFLYEDEQSMSLVIKNVTSADAGVYEVTATNELGEDTKEMHLIVKAAPKIKKKIENQTCMVGESHTVTIEIEGAPAPEVQFYKDGVLIKESERIKIVKESEEVYKIIIKDSKLTDTGSYSVVAKNEVNQCSDFWQWHVTSPPKIIQKMGGNKECNEKETVTFQIKTEAEPPPTVKWFKNKTELVESSAVKITSTGESHTLTVTSAERSSTGEYSCEVSNTHGSVSDSARLDVRTAPIFTQRMKDTTAKVGDVNVEFTVNVEAYPEPSVRWYHGDVEITEKKSVFTRTDSGNSHKLVLKEVSADMSGQYSCRVSNDLGEDSCSATFTVHSKPRITKSLIDMTVDAGQTLKLEVEVEGCPEPRVKWFKDGKEVTTDARIKIERDTHRLENYHLTVTLVKEEDGGEYEVKAENEMGSVSSRSTVTVHSREVHSRFKKESLVENEIDNEHKSKKITEEDVDNAAEKQSGKKDKTKAESAEEKSIWDDVDEDGKAKKPSVDEVHQPTPVKAKKSLTEPEVAEEKSIWDENHNEKAKPSQESDVDAPKKQSGEKGRTKPESVEEVTLDENIKSPKRKSVKKEKILDEPQSAELEGRVFETVTTFKRDDDGSIIMSKVSSSLSHGAIVTGPAETRTLHKMTSTAVYYDDEEDDEFVVRKIIKPNKPHKTSLEVEEIASHSYFLSDLGQYTIPDHIRRGTYGIIEEPPTDSEAENSSRCGRHYSNRTVSIMSVSEDDSSWHNGSLSREISIEDLSKSIFDIDETNRVFSKDSYIRRSSFQEDYHTDDGDEEAFLFKEKSHKIFENDITEKVINISKEFNDNDYKSDKSTDKIKNRLYEELVLGPIKNTDNITRNTIETSLEKKTKHSNKLDCVKEEVDEGIEALLRRSQRQRSILDDILNQEDDRKASPTIKDSDMKDGHVYESLPLVYTVQAVGTPKPIIRWLHNDSEVKPSNRVHITSDGDVYKLEIESVEMGDEGKWQCEISNDLGKKVQKAELSVTSATEFRKPIFTQPLQPTRAPQREPVTLRAVLSAEPRPHVAWLRDDAPLSAEPRPHVAWLRDDAPLAADATLRLREEARDIEHGLKEYTFTLHIPTGRHADTGIYTIKAKNQYGVGESSARLDILLRPEIEGLKDVTAVPYEETTFVARVHANPVAEIQWSKDGYVIKPSSRYDIVEDQSSETYKLLVKKVGVDDGGVYTLTAKNEIGETAQQAKLTVHTGEPVFVKPLQKQTVKDYDDCVLKVRCDGEPKPEVRWSLDGRDVPEDERHRVDTAVGGQVDSELTIKHFNAQDAGKYTVRALSLAGEAACSAEVSLAQIPPGFLHKLERQRDVDEGESLDLKAKLDGSPIPTAKWFKDGVELGSSDPRVQQSATPDGAVRLHIAAATAADCGAYKLVVSNALGEASALCAVAVNPNPRKPSFSKELEDATTSVGQPLKLEAKVMAFPAPEIKWFKDGVPIRPSQAVSFINKPDGLVGLSIESCRPEDAGVYSLTVTNKLGDVSSKAQVHVQQKEKKPAFLAQLQPTKVFEGFPVKLEVKVLGHPPPTIKWTHNGKELVPDGQRVRLSCLPDGSHVLTIDAATAADAGQYGVVATNDKGESSSQAELTVAAREDTSAPSERPKLLQGLRAQTAEEGGALALSARFVGNPVPDVLWTKDGLPLSPSALQRVTLSCDGNRVELEISPVEPSDAGEYGVQLQSALGEDSSSAPVQVRKVYAAPAFSQTFSDLQQLPTFDASFPARVTGVPRPDIEWLKDGQPLREGAKHQLKRDGDAVCLFVRELAAADAGRYCCRASNREGRAQCEAALHVVDSIGRMQRMEPPSFLKKIGDIEVFRGMTAKFTACATGSPDPDVEWFRNGEKLFPCERIRMDKESTGLLRLCIAGVDVPDVATYSCRIFNPHGEETCSAELTYDTLEPRKERRPIADQYSDFDKMKKTGVPMPLTDKPIISRMTDRHLTLSWKPSIPHGPRFPVTYQVEMCELPDGDWFTARSGLRSCVCDIRNLEPFRDYKFRVRVENKYGVSDPSPFAVTHRAKLEPDPPKFMPYLDPGIDFRPETSPYFPKDFDIERPPREVQAQAPRFLRQEWDAQYGTKGHNVSLFWFVYGYPKPAMTYFFNDEPVECGGRFDWSYTRNGQATLFINKMLERDVGWYEAVATNEHGQARQRVRLELAEYPSFITRPDETVLLERRSGQLRARLAGVPFPDIKWYKDWQPLAASARIKIQFIEPDTSILTINDAILKDEGLYSISARNVAGSISSSAMVHVEESEMEYSSRIREHPPRIKPNTKPFGDFYDLGDELGRGVQGVVYHAVERQTGRNYAAKIMHGHSELKPFMKNELDIMNSLNSRHLVRLHDAFEHEHTLALVTELAAGGELLRDRLLRGAFLREADVAGFVRQLLRGLQHLHRGGVAHLGLTLGELLLAHAGSDELQLCDFGLARRVRLDRLASLDYGVPEFVAPEVARGEGVGFAADLWSVGIIAHILLSGHSPFRGANDRETLTRLRLQHGAWAWHDEAWWARLSAECRDFVSRLLVANWRERLDVEAALAHPWLTRADKLHQDDFEISTDRLRNYYNLYRDWMSNASCHTWFRRRPLSGAFEHPSKMVYPPGEIYTPEGSPDRALSPHKPGPWDLKFKQWDHPDWDVSATSESHYQNGPDTYLLQLRDVDFPVRLREYMKVACNRSPTYSLTVGDSYDPRTPIIRERRRFTDIMDEEIDDERRERINNYGTESYTIRRLRHELGTRLDSYAEAEALIESKKDGQRPFFREKPQILPVKDGEPGQLSCFAVGDPKPKIQWFKNDMVLTEGQRIKIVEDEEGRSTLSFNPAMHHDVGVYKVVASNRVAKTVARARIVEATNPDAPDSPTAAEVSDTQVLLRWKQPKYDGNSPVVCYSLQYKAGDSVDWIEVANNIDHEFFVIRDLKPDTSYQFRLSSRNRIGWSDKGIPTNLVKTKESGSPKIEITKAMKHLQQITESGQEIVLDEEKPKLNYSIEEEPIEWDTSDRFTERYSFISELWRGRFSIVVKGVDKTNDNVVVSKILENRPETEVQIKREFDCLRRLRHERISNVLGAYQAPGSPIAALIMEKLQGADILTYLSSRHDYTEQTVATIVTQILDGLQYLHWRGYCHLDLQPDNVVMSSVRSIQVKLVDFGSAHKVTKLGTSVPQVGDLEYKAPEIINDEPAYPQTDIWSLGVLTYIMLSGVSPFRGADDSETKQNISFVRYRFEHLYKEITQEATRFLMFLFKKVPQKRPLAEECFDHRWLTQSDFMIKRRERAVFLGNRLKEFSEAYHEKKAAAASLADTLATAFPRLLTRSNSVQEELLTNFSSH